jgi:D-cysteine desulfhydrase
MAADDLALLRAFPALRGALPRRPLVDAPTPVEPLEIDGLAPGRLYVKRDDVSAARYGGNKPRKLELLIGAALERGSRRLVTVGAIGSNHGLATTIHGGDAGLATTRVLIDQPPTPGVRDNLLLDAAYGAELVYGRTLPGALLGVTRVLARSTLRGEHPTWIPAGGSTPLGTVGFVSAAFELAEQIRAGALPEPDEIYVPVGTAGTHVGLALGARLAGLRSRVVGVLVTDILPPTAARMRRAARATLGVLQSADPSVPDPGLDAMDFALVRDQLGGGYGVPTDGARAAIEASAAAGLRLEATYTGKCMAAILSRAAAGTLPSGPVLFWNTFDSVDPRPGAPRPLDPARLPPELRRRVADALRSSDP